MPNPRQFHRINYALAATLLTAGETLDSIVPKVGAKNANTLRVGLSRRGVTATNARARPFTQEPPRSVTLKLATAAAEVLKQSIGSSAMQAAENLATVKPGRTVKQIKAYAEALEPLSRVGDRLYGWSASAGPTWNVTVLDLAPVSCVSDAPTPAQISDSVIDVKEVPPVTPTPSDG